MAGPFSGALSMRCPKKVLILVNSKARYREIPYLMGQIAGEWVRHGSKVTVTDRVDRSFEADLVVSHIDLTTVPDAHRRLLARHPRVLNGGVFDISKRRISQNLLTGPEGFEGPVIVKTDRNCGGVGELAQFASRGRLARGLLRGLGRLPWSVSGLVPSDRYPIYPHPRHVPWPVWRNPRLVVEKFRPEVRDGLYCLRTYIFLGDREVNTLAYANSPQAKAANFLRREVLEGAPAELHALRRALGFDFGKFDYAISDGEVVLYDANSTPTLVDATSERARARAAELALGIEAFVASPESDPTEERTLLQAAQ